MHKATAVVVVVAALGAVAAFARACDTRESSDSATTERRELELAPPVRIEVTGESNDPNSAVEMAGDDSLGAMSIAPGGDMVDDSGFGGDWVWMTTRFVAGDALGPLPTDDVAYHYPPGAQATRDQVRDLAAHFGIVGEPVAGDPAMGSQWVVEATDGSGARLEVAADATLSWWMAGGTRRPDLVSGAPDALGRVDYASGWLADAIPTGPYPLIGIDEAIERLTAQWGSWSVAMPYSGDLDPDAPVASPEAAGSEAIGSDAAGSETRESEPIDIGRPEPIDIGDVPTTEFEVELVSVSADLWSSWAADGSMWMVPAYRFEASDGGVYTIAAITDEYLVQMDPYAVPDPGQPVIDPPFIDDPFDGLDLEGVRDALVGLTLSEAEELIYENGWSWTLRAVRVDGEDLPVTADYQPDRVNIITESGEIVDVTSFG